MQVAGTPGPFRSLVRPYEAARVFVLPFLTGNKARRHKETTTTKEDQEKSQIWRDVDSGLQVEDGDGSTRQSWMEASDI